ncbi:YqgE/AlgH family protein [Rhodobacteraceae bacterium NNCM2]|nr:YqgE/AlgH family protein [Coraliihabitans acroporae]
MSQTDDSNGSFLDGHLLIAMPGMRDPRFHRTLVYLCAHSADGAMGLIVNKPAESLMVSDLYERLNIPHNLDLPKESVRFGGPVETGRGFVLHSADYHAPEATLRVDRTTSMTATLEILHLMAGGEGPAERMVALGYAGWSPGQLEAELQANGWLLCSPDKELLFGTDNESKWDRAMAKLGIDPRLLSSGGNA